MSIFKFEPLSDAQAAELKYGLWPEGIYQFRVLEAYETVSKSGNSMIKVLLEFHKEDSVKKITDYLLLDTKSQMRYKLKHFCDTLGLSSVYEKGEIDNEDFIGKFGNAQLGIQESKDAQYHDRNVVSDYVLVQNITGHTLTANAKVVNKIQDDEIPFN